MYQNIILIGNVGKEPELRFTPKGKAVCNFSLATNEKFWTGDEESKDITTWWRVTCWGKTAETVHEYVKKGAKVLVECRIKPGEDGNPEQYKRMDGTWGSSYEVTASIVRFLDRKEPENYDEVAW